MNKTILAAVVLLGATLAQLSGVDVLPGDQEALVSNGLLVVTGVTGLVAAIKAIRDRASAPPAPPAE